MKSVLKVGSIVIVALGLCAANPAGAAKEKTLYSFRGKSDGGTPEAGLIADGSGNLFGTTELGGANSAGIVFRINPDGTETVLYAFCSLSNCADGGEPYSSLIADTSGNLYGTTKRGGSGGEGTVFKLAPDGTETVIHSFQNDGTDGMNPQGEIAMDTSGTIYGTTLNGGSYTWGTVFKISPKGKESVLYFFKGYPVDGVGPWGGVAVDKSRNVYGTTYAGGDFSKCESGCGIVFQVGPDGTETILHTFEFSDGYAPYGTVTADNSGDLYGITTGGGSGGLGTIFKVYSGGTFTELYNFASGTDGAGPFGNVILDSSGNLYGTTSSAGGFGHGTVFRLAPGGTETVLHSFGGTSRDGAYPDCGLLLNAGHLYGTTVLGGKHNAGTVFDLKK